MNKSNLTYEKSGVNIKAADKFVKFISNISKKSKKKGKNKNIGGFGAINKIPKLYRDAHIVTSTDGVGTKIEIANIFNKFDTIGIDLVAMCVNDLIVQGSKPYLFLDYISINKIDLKKIKSIVRGIIKGCNISDCELVGGETAEMPGTYSRGKFDIAGFAVGLVDKKNILKKNIKNNKYLKTELLKPTKIYTREILKLIEKKLINGCANITGGGIKDNIKRVIPSGLVAEINLGNIKIHKIFKYLKKLGISDNEMLKTFNCGVGFCLIVNKKNVHKIKKYFKKNYQPYMIGKISKGNNVIKVNEKFIWK